MKRTVFSLLLLFAFLWAGAAPALDLGELAPEAKPGTWVQGSAVDLNDRKNIYIIDFWATWCRPCRETIPHMSELQARHKADNVVVLGVSDEDRATIERFLVKMSGKMDFRVAADDTGSVAKAFKSLPGFNGIPFAVVIDRDGKIAWFGHPLGGLDRAVAQIVNGTYDISAQKLSRQAKKLIPAYFKALAANDPGTHNLGEKIIEDGASDPNLLNGFAWDLLTEVPPSKRDLPLAKLAAETAYLVGGKTSPEITDTYALALFEEGDVASAIRYQKDAIALCKDPLLLAQLKETLRRYEAAK